MSLDKNELTQVRRENLKKWFSDKVVPEKDRSYISQLISGKTPSFGEKAARRLESENGMPPFYLDIKQSSIESNLKEIGSFDLLDCNTPVKYRIEVIDVEASAGFGIATYDTVELISAIEYTETQYFLMFNNIPAKDIKIINVKGDSMSPTLESGDLLFINVKVQSYEGDGIYVFSYGNHLYVKRLQMTADELLIISDNKNYKEWKVTEENEHKFRVHGKVLIGQSQSFKRYG